MLAEWVRERDADEIAEQLQAAGVAAAPVLSPLMLAGDAHLAARGFFLSYTHADLESPARTARPAWRMHRRPIEAVRAAPRFGEHSREVLGEVGYSEAEIDALEAAGITSRELLD